MNPDVLEWAASLTAKQARWLAAIARHDATQRATQHPTATATDGPTTTEPTP